ncbi:hypothetical protein FVA81_23885 [Rhizobium sp. WL3]|uniref:hypothetical protein n=1 Tax=Rhizobium sp. WL3 TaxID=2603277 RepID=UPI0011C1D23A|nr:hypothetical protein [Rhizobium sp. WL3]MBX9467029.1 hypothetical protein [Rhizobium sp.]QEE47458.1 hypothetical protein FVA81_23885 [Rhizobium sp. WL3]
MTGMRRLVTILCVTLGAVAVQAQEGGRKAIAYVQAPEMSSGLCVETDTASAIDCALKQCIAGGGTVEDCQVNAVCHPGNWSVDIFMMADGGPHWHQFSCGWQTRELALKAADLACSNAKEDNLIECTAVQLIDEDGTVTEPPFN